MACKDTKWNSVTMDNEGHDLRISFKIKNFLDHVCNPGEITETPQIECAQLCGAKWVLQVQLYGKGGSYSDPNSVVVSLKLVNKPGIAKIMTGSYKIYILDSRGKKLKVQLCNVVEAHLVSGYPVNLVKRSEIHNEKDIYLSNEHLSICCEGKVFYKKPNLTLKTETLPQIVSSSQYSELVKKMYQESICSDVVLKTGSSEFKCHKAVLATTSAYFKAMFEHDMKENRDNVVILVNLSKDLEEEELKALLDFIYLGSDKLPTLSVASYQNLFRVSDMYELEGLKRMCERELIGQLISENAMELLIFSEEFEAKRLKKAAALAIASSLD